MKKIYLLAGLFAAFCNVNAQQLATFDDVELSPDSFYNGSDDSGGFASGGLWFPNDYDSDWGSWSGFTVSNMKDTVTAGYENQYSAITGSGSALSENYAVVYWPGNLKMEFDSAVEVTGFEVTNSTLTYLMMRDGDSNGFSRKFGGIDGSDPDFLKLLVWGIDSLGSVTDTTEFYLADYTSDNSGEDYLVNTWEWMDLTGLGIVKELHFGMESSDVGDWGMNTPAYFCMDNFTVNAKLTSLAGIAAVKNPEVMAYPNPVKDNFIVEIDGNAEKITLTDSSGRMLLSQETEGRRKINVSALNGLKPGVYFLKVDTGSGLVFRKLIKK